VLETQWFTSKIGQSDLALALKLKRDEPTKAQHLDMEKGYREGETHTFVCDIK
jgi:hypothetical protein